MTCHGGQLVIDSKPGEGSRISLVFPAAAACKPHLAAVA
jgi:signal transduction histidine kinase